jgi:hypothetical protein
MYVLDEEYKHGMHNELKGFGKMMNEGFQTLTEGLQSLEKRMSDGFATVDKRFSDVDKRFNEVDKRFDDVDNRMNNGFVRLDNKIDLTASELRSEIKDSKISTIQWAFSFFVALALMILAIYLKK